MTFHQQQQRDQLQLATVTDMIFQKDKEVIIHSHISNFHLATTPAPSLYQLKSGFSNSPSSTAKSFGIAREAYSKVYLKESPPMDKSIPGPG